MRRRILIQLQKLLDIFAQWWWMQIYEDKNVESPAHVKPQAYTSKRRILIQVLPSSNVYTKSGDPYIHFAKEQHDLA